MDLSLSKEHKDLQANARDFVERYLYPHEIENDENQGLPAETVAMIRQASVDYGVLAMNHSREDGGRGYSILEQTLVNEQLGRATGALWSIATPRN